MPFTFGALAHVALAQSQTREERWSYECGKSLGAQQMGPVFWRHNVLITSVRDRQGQPLLLLNTQGGLYAGPLKGQGIHRVRVELPNQEVYYLQYLPGAAHLRDRLFEMHAAHLDSSLDEIEYQIVALTRATYLLHHMEYAFHQTLENLTTAIIEGRIERREVVPIQRKDCGYLKRKSPRLAETLARQIDLVEMLTWGPQSHSRRMPASAHTRP